MAFNNVVFFIIIIYSNIVIFQTPRIQMISCSYIFGPLHVRVSTWLLGLITRLVLGDQVSSLITSESGRKRG